MLGVLRDGKARAYLGSLVTAAGGVVDDEFDGRKIHLEYSTRDAALPLGGPGGRGGAPRPTGSRGRRSIPTPRCGGTPETSARSPIEVMLRRSGRTRARAQDVRARRRGARRRRSTRGRAARARRARARRGRARSPRGEPAARGQLDHAAVVGSRPRAAAPRGGPSRRGCRAAPGARCRRGRGSSALGDLGVEAAVASVAGDGADARGGERVARLLEQPRLELDERGARVVGPPHQRVRRARQVDAQLEPLVVADALRERGLEARLPEVAASPRASASLSQPGSAPSTTRARPWKRTRSSAARVAVWRQTAATTRRRLRASSSPPVRSFCSETARTSAPHARASARPAASVSGRECRRRPAPGRFAPPPPRGRPPPRPRRAARPLRSGPPP